MQLFTVGNANSQFATMYEVGDVYVYVYVYPFHYHGLDRILAAQVIKDSVFAIQIPCPARVKHSLLCILACVRLKQSWLWDWLGELLVFPSGYACLHTEVINQTLLCESLHEKPKSNAVVHGQGPADAVSNILADDTWTALYLCNVW